ncbi:MAG TPA: aldolase/citrate lyase family protein, partial [Caulobacteraceae bacterium]|nr:aldolase/citrate lyase family protein [Caulobacteraceae bacterium]
MRQNLALAKWRRGEPAIGGWLQLPTTHSAELMSHAGFDYLCVDLQHGMVEPVDLARMLPAISTTDTTPLVRVVQNDPGQIMRALDLGAMGVIV